MRGVTLLYEDSAGPRGEFGLHELVRQCVADALGCDLRSLKDPLRGYPKNGVGNVLAACRRDLAQLAHGGRTVVAVVDDDKIRRAVSLEKAACKVQVVQRFREHASCPPGVALRVVLLVRNTESILLALRDEGLLPDRDARFEAAIVHKELNSRDLLFKDAVWRLSAEQRVTLQRCVPSLGYLVARVRAALSPPA
jgi:hypothetical protein